MRSALNLDLCSPCAGVGSPGSTAAPVDHPPSCRTAEQITLPARTTPALLGWRYFWAFACVALLIVLNQVLVQPSLIRVMSDAPVINIAGRQRMLSQRLTKAALA